MKNIDIKTQNRNLSWLLVKNRLIAQLNINVFRYEKNRHIRNRKIAMAIIIIFVLIMVMGYCGSMAYGYAYLGLSELIPGIAMVISSLITLLFTMFKANGELFGFKDYEKVMSLPIPVKTIINSRFLNMYLYNTFVTFLVLFPMGIVYAYFTKPSLDFYILWLLSIFLTCLIPTTLAAIFGAVITAISSKFRYTSAVSTILAIVFVAVIIVFSMTATTTDIGLGEIFDPITGNIDEGVFSSLAPVISNTLYQAYPPAELFSEAVVNGSISSFLLFAGISISWYALFIFVLSIKYKQINTALTSHMSKANYKLKTLRQGSMFFALYKKTIMRILKSTVCATNMLIGCIIAILTSVAIVVIGPDKLLQSATMSEYMDIVKNIAYYALAAIVCMSNTSAVSLALEGRNIWIIKSLPIPPKILYDSYLLTNLTFTIPTSIVCSILLSISLKTNFISTILMILTPLAFSLFTAVIGIFIGNRMAYYDWQDETQLIKQSMLSMFGMLGGMVFIIICGAIATTGILPGTPNMITFILNVLILSLTALIYLNESNRPIK